MAFNSQIGKLSLNGDLEILLMGLTGHGKSATGNTILGHENFLSRGGWGSVTKNFHVGATNINGRNVKVVDIPGFADTDEKSDKEKLQLVLNALTKAIVQVPNGFHAVLLVVPYTVRLTEGQRSNIQHLINLFDSKAFKSHGILVLSSGDAFKRDYRGGSLTLQQWIEKQSPKDRWVFETCSSRCVLFDNVTENEKAQADQVNELIKRIDSLDNGKKRYLPEISKCSEGERDLVARDKRKVIDLESLINYIGLLKSSVLKCMKDKDVKNLIKETAEVKEMIVNNKEYSKYQLNFTTIFSSIDSFNRDPSKAFQEQFLIDLCDKCTDLQNEFGALIEKTAYWQSTFRKIESFFANITVGIKKACAIS